MSVEGSVVVVRLRNERPIVRRVSEVLERVGGDVHLSRIAAELGVDHQTASNAVRRLRELGLASLGETRGTHRFEAVPRLTERRGRPPRAPRRSLDPVSREVLTIVASAGEPLSIDAVIERCAGGDPDVTRDRVKRALATHADAGRLERVRRGVYAGVGVARRRRLPTATVELPPPPVTGGRDRRPRVDDVVRIAQTSGDWVVLDDDDGHRWTALVVPGWP